MSDKKVTITYPCSIDWNSMQQVDGCTRYCDSCKKNIPDFTVPNSHNLSEIHCGRFNLNQVSNIRREVSFRKASIVSLSLISLLGLSAVAGEFSAGIEKKSTVVNQNKENYITINGIVKDKKENTGISYAIVSALHKGKILAAVQTSMLGRFSLKIDVSNIKIEDIEIVIKNLDYKTGTIKLSELPQDKLEDGTVILELEAVLNLLDIKDSIFLTGEVYIDKLKVKDLSDRINKH